MSKTTKILVLPGMGDIYWVMVKLESFIAQNKITDPVVYTWEIQPHKNNRSADYIKRIPFVTYGGPWYHDQNLPEFKAVYFGNTWLIPNFQEFDYLFSVNGVLRNGLDLNSCGLGALDTNWYFPLTESQEEIEAEKRYMGMGDYVIGYFSDTEMYKHWMKSLTTDDIFYILSQIYERTGCKIVMTGCEWDKGLTDELKARDEKGFIEDIIGETSIDELFALMKHSKGMIGWCGGNTIKSVYLKVPTVILWSEYFPREGFYKNSVPPDSIGDWHEYKVVECHSAEDIANTMVNVIKRGRERFYDQQIELYKDGGMPELALIKDWIKNRPGNIAIDIGANIGELSYYLSEQCDVKTVEAFEPNPEVFKTLVNLNPANINPHCVALSNVEDTSTLFVPSMIDGYSLNTGLSSLHPEWIEKIHEKYPDVISDQKVTYDVEVKVLDDYNFESIKVIKIDVEGHERQVLEGATKTIQKWKPILIVEAYQNLELFNTIMEYGFYRCFYYDDSLGALSEACDINDLPEQVVNLIFKPL